jgi:hypothetical protein
MSDTIGHALKAEVTARVTNRDKFTLTRRF